MSYYASYTLSVQSPNKSELLDIINVIENDKMNDSNIHHWQDPFGKLAFISKDETYACFSPKDEYAWHDYKSDMEILSARFPESIFMVHVNGDDEYDESEEEYSGGKRVRRRHVMPCWSSWQNG